MLRRPPTAVANVLSALALFVALGGAAYAATALPKNSVKTKSIANGAVTTAKLRNGAVTGAKLRNGAIATGKLVNGAITTPKIAEGAVGATQIANGAVRAGQLGGQVVTEPKIKNGAVSESKLGAESVTTGKIKKEAVTAATLSPSLAGQLVKNVSYVSKTSASDETSPKTATAECPAGREVLGGGARTILGSSLEASVSESLPFVDGGGKHTGWTAKAAGSTGTFALEVVAICAEL
jgi:hypothetical protein